MPCRISQGWIFDHFRHATSSIAKHTALHCSAVGLERNDRAASTTGVSEMPVLASGNRPPTIAPLATPRNGCASAALARSSIDLSLGIRSSERIAGVGGLCLRPKCSDSPAILCPPCTRCGELICIRHCGAELRRLEIALAALASLAGAFGQGRPYLQMTWRPNTSKL